MYFDQDYEKYFGRGSDCSTVYVCYPAADFSYLENFYFLCVFSLIQYLIVRVAVWDIN